MSRLKTGKARTVPERSRNAAAPAKVDIGKLVRATMLDVLKAESDAIVEAGAWRDKSTVDNFGVHHPRGGFWNTDDPMHAALGYGKTKINQTRVALKRKGLSLTNEQVDGYLSQLVRTNALDEATLEVGINDEIVTVPLTAAARSTTRPMPEPVMRALVERKPGYFVVIPVDNLSLRGLKLYQIRRDGIDCGCAQGRCPNIIALYLQRSRGIPRYEDVSKIPRETIALVCRLVSELRPWEQRLSRGEANGRARNAAQRAMHLVLAEALGPQFRTLPQVRAKGEGTDSPLLGDAKHHPRNSDQDVVALLVEAHVGVWMALEERFKDLEPMLLTGEKRGDLVARELVRLLRSVSTTKAREVVKAAIPVLPIFEEVSGEKL